MIFTLKGWQINFNMKERKHCHCPPPPRISEVWGEAGIDTGHRCLFSFLRHWFRFTAFSTTRLHSPHPSLPLHSRQISPRSPAISV